MTEKKPRIVCDKTVKRNGNWYHIVCRCGAYPRHDISSHFPLQLYKMDWEGHRLAALLIKLREQGWEYHKNKVDPRTWAYECAKCAAASGGNEAA
jgi:hypothetical protein